MGGASGPTRPVVEGGVGVGAGVTVVAAGSVTQQAGGVAAPADPLIRVVVETLGTVEHTVAFVEEVVLLTFCQNKSAGGWEGQKSIFEKRANEYLTTFGYILPLFEYNQLICLQVSTKCKKKKKEISFHIMFSLVFVIS